MNLYAYVGNDPLSKTDPTGMYQEETVTTCDALCQAGAIQAAARQEAAQAFVRGMQNVQDNFASVAIYHLTGQKVGMVAAVHGMFSKSEKNKDRPEGAIPADKGADKWGAKNGKGKKEGRRKFHKIKQRDGMSGAADDWSVNPDTGDVFDPAGDNMGNLGESGL